VLLVRGNQVMDAQDGVAAASFCKGARFEPFPEIMQQAGGVRRRMGAHHLAENPTPEQFPVPAKG
jgi:hypothetical protein